MLIHIRLLNETDLESLYTFECSNRNFFETLVPSRGDNFYLKESFTESLYSLLDEQEEEISLFYLIINNNNEIVGRINIVDIDSEKHSANLGYRIGEPYLKQGIASTAVHLVQKEAKKRNITTLHAKTTNRNIGSQKVLENTSFECLGVEKNTFIMNGQELSYINYIWKANQKLL